MKKKKSEVYKNIQRPTGQRYTKNMWCNIFRTETNDSSL